jgi:putative aldouronate transport system permease protein
MESLLKSKNVKYFLKNKYLYLLLLPCVIYFILFRYVPMYGVIIAFKNFDFSKGILGSPWVGFQNFIYLFHLKDFYSVLINSVTLSVLRLILCFPIPIILAVMLNEIPFLAYKKLTQTFIYLPYFISWVVIGGILISLLSPSWGIVNGYLKDFGVQPIFFLGSDKWFRAVYLVSGLWKQAGWDTIIYLAAITSVSPELYDAAQIDGANRFQQIWHITLSCIKSTIIIMLLLNIGSILNNGFEQVFILQNNSNIVVSEVFETYTYKLGVVSGRYSFATTVGLFSASVGFVLLVIGNSIAKLIGEDGIF